MLAGCPECDAKIGEPCKSDKGTTWRAQVHYARRLAAKGPRKQQRTAETERKHRRAELLESLWAALKLEDRQAVHELIRALHRDDVAQDRALRAAQERLTAGRVKVPDDHRKESVA